GCVHGCIQGEGGYHLLYTAWAKSCTFVQHKQTQVTCTRPPPKARRDPVSGSNGREFELVATLRLGALCGSRRQLQDRMGGEAGRETPRPDAVADLLHLLVAVDVDQIDGK